MRADWGKTTIRGAAILALLAGAACQRNGGDASSGNGMFGTAGAKNGTAAAPGPAAVQPMAQPPAQPVTQPPAAPAIAPDPMAQGPVGPAAQDRRLRINNASGQAVTIIRGSASSENDWGQDRIPSGVLQSGATVMVDFNDGNGECVYDLQATMEDRTVRVRRGVNVCRAVDWTITPDGSEVR